MYSAYVRYILPAFYLMKRLSQNLKGKELKCLHSFLIEAITEARLLQEAKKAYQSIEEQLADEIRLTQVERITLMLEKEIIDRSSS